MASGVPLESPAAPSGNASSQPPVRPRTGADRTHQSSHFYWNMASVRAIVPGQIKDEQLFQPLTAAFERYPNESYEIIVGSAGKVDTGAKTVLVSLPGSSDRSLTYDHLVVATGSRCTTSNVPWKILDSYDETVSLLDSTRERVGAARHIVVAGAGATGVEVAGELGFEYGKEKEITLLCGGPALLDGDSVGPAAKAELLKLDVKIKFDARVAGAKELPDGKTEVSLQNGETVVADLYLPTMGMKGNTEMLDGKYLTDKGYVAVDEFYRVKGAENDGVWALGDVVSVPRGGFLFTQKQVSYSHEVHHDAGVRGGFCLLTGSEPGRRRREERPPGAAGQEPRNGEAHARRRDGLRGRQEPGRREDGPRQDAQPDGVACQGSHARHPENAGLHRRKRGLRPVRMRLRPRARLVDIAFATTLVEVGMGIRYKTGRGRFGPYRRHKHWIPFPPPPPLFIPHHMNRQIPRIGSCKMPKWDGLIYLTTFDSLQPPSAISGQII